MNGDSLFATPIVENVDLKKNFFFILQEFAKQMR